MNVHNTVNQLDLLVDFQRLIVNTGESLFYSGLMALGTFLLLQTLRKSTGIKWLHRFEMKQGKRATDKLLQAVMLLMFGISIILFVTFST